MLNKLPRLYPSPFQLLLKVSTEWREGSTIHTHDCKRGNPKPEHDFFTINWAYGSLEAMKILEHTTSLFQGSPDT